MNGDVIYLDSSAFVKLFLPEPDSPVLSRFLATRPHRVSGMVLRTEALRTAVRAMLSPPRMLLVRALLDSVSFIPADPTLSDEAGILRPLDLRSLDAIHLATARSLGTNLAALVTYDQRLAGAAARYGMPVVSPS